MRLKSWNYLLENLIAIQIVQEIEKKTITRNNFLITEFSNNLLAQGLWSLLGRRHLLHRPVGASRRPLRLRPCRPCPRRSGTRIPPQYGAIRQSPTVTTALRPWITVSVNILKKNNISGAKVRLNMYIYIYILYYICVLYFFYGRFQILLIVNYNLVLVLGYTTISKRHMRSKVRQPTPVTRRWPVSSA